MTTLANTNPTLAELAKRRDPDGNVAKIIELMSEQNDIVDDITMQEGNLATGHQTSVRVGLPTTTWRKLYGFVTPTKSKVVQVTDSCGMMVQLSSIDEKEAELNGNQAIWRMTEDVAHIEAMTQEFADTLIYGNEGTEPEAFTGLAPRYGSLSAESADNIIDAFSGSGGDLTSIYLLTWHPTTAFCFSPKGGASGLQMKDKGRVTIFNGSGGQRDDLQTEYSWDVGFCLRDWRFGGRIANIDVSDNDASTTSTNAQKLLRYMIMLQERLPSTTRGRAAWYMSRTLRTNLRLAALDKVSNQLTYETVAGKKLLMFDGTPIRRVDKISHTESRVV